MNEYKPGFLLSQEEIDSVRELLGSFSFNEIQPTIEMLDSAMPAYPEYLPTGVTAILVNLLMRLSNISINNATVLWNGRRIEIDDSRVLIDQRTQFDIDKDLSFHELATKVAQYLAPEPKSDDNND